MRGLISHALRRYWPLGADPVEHLPIPALVITATESLPPSLAYVVLPDWAADLAPPEGMLVPKHLIAAGSDEPWTRTDWWQAAFWYLNCSAERAHERVHGPIHSYSMRLDGWDPAMCDYAWVNRIALFLRRWAARLGQKEEGELLGSLPRAEISITHDVDAVRKTLAIRLKQTAFCGFNGLRRLLRGQAYSGTQKLAQGMRFLLGNHDYRLIEQIARLEDAHGLRSRFNLYGGGGRLCRSPKNMLFDPGYDVGEPVLAASLRKLVADGWQMGVHQSFDAWADANRMRNEKLRVEAALGRGVTTCRQHWLRFGWDVTWPAQVSAGFALDTTLGFNDRPGFRAGAALQFSPSWALGRSDFEVLPMVLMDSHLYDYLDLDKDERERELRRWLDEVRFVRGQASVIWHTHVLAGDYGWGDGFQQLLAALGDVSI